MIKKYALYVGLLLVLLVAVFGFLLITNSQTPKTQIIQPFSFETKDSGFSEDKFYLVADVKGQSEIQFLGLNSSIQKEIYVLNQKAIGSDSIPALVDSLQKLERYNYTVKTVSETAEVKSGLYIIPSGAMPLSVLDRIKSVDYSNLKIIYIGSKNLAYKDSVKNYDWYSDLPEQLKERITVFNTTLDELAQSANFSISDYVLKSKWALTSYKSENLKSGLQTLTFNTNNATYVRVLLENKELVFNNPLQNSIEIQTQTDLYQWEKPKVLFTLNQTNGTAYLVLEKNSELRINKSLGRFPEESVLQDSLDFTSPGNYLLKIKDNSGVIGIKVIHVKDIEITYVESRDSIYHTFKIAVDGIPVQQGNLSARLKGSENKKDFFISDGTVTIPAKLNDGKTAIIFNYLEGVYEVFLSPNSANVLDLYLMYGPIGLAIIIAVFIIFRFNKKPIYILRIGNAAQEIRKELRVSTNRALEIFTLAGKELGISGPLNVQEFTLGLKRHLTSGADITEGNVEEILRKMENLGMVESYKSYYQKKQASSIKKNFMLRSIKEKLISIGKEFKVKNNRFITKDYEIGFFGDKLRNKSIFVFEDYKDLKETLDGMTEKERSILFLKEFNGILELTTLEKLEESL